MKTMDILNINERAGATDNVLRFDKGSAMFSFPQEFFPFIDNVKKEIKNQYFHYPKIGGEIELKKQIIKLEKNNRREASLEMITVTHGGMSGLFTFFSVVCSPNDEVITNLISFEGFSTLCNYFKLKQKRVNLTNITQVEKMLTKKTKVIIINSPENPTGKVYSKKEIEALLKLSKKKKIYVLCDEVMNKIIYDKTALYGPGLENKNVVVVNSFSKTWFIPGIRLGWMTSQDDKLIEKFSSSLVNQSIGVNLFGQLLMTKICNNLNYETFLKKRLDLLKNKRAMIKQYLKEYKIDFYQDVEGGMNYYINLKNDSSGLVEIIFKKHKIALIPGSLFEGKKSTFARLGFGAVREKEIKKGIETISKYI